MFDEIEARVRASMPVCDRWSLRLVDDRSQEIAVRQDIVQPIQNERSTGAMVTVQAGAGVGYGATSDLSTHGLKRAIDRALQAARHSADHGLLTPAQVAWPEDSGRYATPVVRAWDSLSLGGKITLLQQASRALGEHESIVDWHAALTHRQTDTRLIGSGGAAVDQSLHYLSPELVAVANRGTETQVRSFGCDRAAQGGLEHLSRIGFEHTAERIAAEALQLLDAPDSPTQTMDVLLMPAQMILQIHESIGHPLELDRILGDERNYAGASFVTADMFGRYRYGSELLNITFDPTRPSELATYGYDDEGSPAARQYLIREGILQSALGSATSQRRAGIAGVANARACDWNRPAIDRMANLNLEPGDHTLDELIATIENGVLMDTNRSWSIDDNRNKFQFGCELGYVIHNGERQGLVKNPGYRGISADFWRSLAAVGDADTFDVLGVANCGKGEPNQGIHAGHAAPACVFRDVAVFGGQ